MKPVLQALLVADQIYTDRATNKKVICGIFHNIYRGSNADPKKLDGLDHESKMLVASGGSMGSPHAYLSMTEIRGKQEFELRYVYLDTDKPLFKTGFELDSPSPLLISELVLPLPTLPVNELGTYALELLWKNEVIGMYRIIVESLDAVEPTTEEE